MKKKILSILTLLCMVTVLLPANITVFASTVVSGTCGDNLTWTLDDSGTLTIRGTGKMAYWSSSNTPWYSSNGRIKAVIIESGVTDISDYAFYYCVNLTSVIIPDSVTRIGNWVFRNCGSLTSVTIGNCVTRINERAFEDCSSLTSITIPNSVTSIEWRAFYNCNSLTSINIPDSVKNIGSNAFAVCNNLTSVTIGNGVISIGEKAFYDCSSLTSIAIPDSVTSIGSNVFYNTGYYNNDSNWKNGILYMGNHLIKSKDMVTSYEIKKGTKLIADYAFYNCISLTNVTIPGSITNIGDRVFYGCSSLTNITIPDSVTSIGSNVFYNTGYYNNDSNWENDVLYIRNYLLYAKDTITSCKIKKGTKLIAGSAFDYHQKLTSVTIPNSVISIGEYAFRHCDSLKSLTISDSVKSIGDYAFDTCCNLKNVYYNGTENDWNSITIGSSNTNLTNAARTYFAYINFFDKSENKMGSIMQNIGETVDLNSIEIPDGYVITNLYKDKEMTKEYSLDTPICENLNLYCDIIELNKLKIAGVESADIGQKGITESITFATDKTAKDFVATIKYSDKLNLSAITEKNFSITENLSETKNGYTYLYLTCTYKNDGNMPKNTTLNAFDLVFNVSESATANEKLTIEFVNDETFLADSGANTYDFEGLGTAEIKVNPISVKSITINGADEIDKAAQYTAVISPENATNKDIEWTVDNSEIATISADGILTPVKAGTVKIKATAKDGNDVYAEKAVNVKVYAQITSLTASAGEWDKTFTPSEREYTIYVPKNTSSIKLNPQYNGTLKLGTQTLYNNRKNNVTMTGDETVLTLTYSQTGYTDSEYKIKIVKFEGTKTTVLADGKVFTVKPTNIASGNTIILALYSGEEFVAMQSAVYSGKDIPFTVTDDYITAKVMVWNNLDDIMPICDVEIVK